MLADILPTQKLLLIDLVRAAGVDVSDWARSKRGQSGAAMNPKYCFEWSFIEPGNVVVINIWRHSMKEETSQVVTVDLNMRQSAAKRPEPERTRALKMDSAIQTAIRDRLPIRVVVLAGKRRGDPGGPSAGPSKVSMRLLDPVVWGVETYESQTGQCRLQRGLRAHLNGASFIPHPDIDEDALSGVEGRKKWIQHLRRERDRRLVSEKKARVLAQTGRLACEACGFHFSEFYHPYAQDFCEVHHRMPLANLEEAAETKLEDLAIMCSNCHRVIHLIRPMPNVEQLRALLRERPRQRQSPAEGVR
jgi:hypothetical protein